jgi:hypothetical protein
MALQYSEEAGSSIRFIDPDGYAFGMKQTLNRLHMICYVWDPDSLDYVPMEQPATSAGEVTVDFPESVQTSPKAYAIRILEDSGYTYVGKAEPGSAEDDSAWQIMRIDETIGVEILFANGSEAFNQRFDQCLSLSYS